MERKPKTLQPFIKMCATIGALPTSYLVSMTYEEQLIWLCNFLEKEVIPVVNNNSEVVKELQEWFENLDVQEEVNNKIDEMYESGQLQEIIIEYLELNGVLGYNTVADMKDADNLIEGSICKTLGTTDYMDGYGNYYKIRVVTTEDVIDEINIISLTNYPTFIAEKIPNTYITNINTSISNVNNKIGDLEDLTTTSKTNVVSAINELKTYTNKIGDLENLNTEAKNNLVSAINEINDKTFEYVNIKDYGATGDGVTDDSEAIQDALDYAGNNGLIVFIPKPDVFYAIGTGLNVPSGVAGIIGEVWNYTGTIRPIASGITCLTINPTMGAFYKNISIGSSSTITANGILYVGHTGINIFNHIRIYNLNGYGIKFNAIWDSLIDDLSIEKCGNASDYAFSFNDDGDTCNHTVINHLQVEQSNTKSISIDYNTLCCVFNDIHSERAGCVNNTMCWTFGGNHCTYNNMRLSTINTTDAGNVCRLSGTNTTFNNVLIPEHITVLGYAYVSNCIINGSTISDLSETVDMGGNLIINDSTIITLTPSRKTTINNCNVTTYSMSYMTTGAYARCFNSIIDTVTKISDNAVGYFVNCKISTLAATAYISCDLINCTVSNNVNSGYCQLRAYNTTFNGNLGNSGGGYRFKFIDVTVLGTVSSVYSSTPNFTVSDIGYKTENLNPTSGSYSGWVYTSGGWKGYGLIA